MFPLWCRGCGHVPSVVQGVWSCLYYMYVGCSLCGVGGVVMSVLYVCRMFPLWCRVCGHVPSVV